jgi:hypothetical protein
MRRRQQASFRCGMPCGLHSPRRQGGDHGGSIATCRRTRPLSLTKSTQLGLPLSESDLAAKSTLIRSTIQIVDVTGAQLERSTSKLHRSA